MSKLMIYKVILNKNTQEAYIEDEDGIRYIQFMPHPDGDPWMDKVGIDIILDVLHIVSLGEWEEAEDTWEKEIKVG